jgi:hypothetical protein
MKKIWNGLAIFLFGVTAVGTITSCSYGGINDAIFEKQMLEASSQQNKSLPMMVDKDTRWDTTIPGPGKNWTYIYTLTNPELKNISNEKINEVLGSKIRSGVCTMKDMEIFVKNGVTVKYKYRDNDGKFIGEVVVVPEDCKKA